jgi:hypothetical protein
MSHQIGIDFGKQLGGDFDRIDLKASHASDWLNITMHVGHDVQRITMTLRSEEAVRDLHHGLTRYLELLDRERAR